MRCVTSFLVLAAAATLAAPATAHGPCSCTFPQLARPGQTVRTARAYRIVWNPTSGYFAGAAGPRELASAFRADAPTRVVLDRDRPPYPRRARVGRFDVPQDTPPGLYLVLVFDGSEGGQHATWDYVHVPFGPLGAALELLRRVFELL